MAADGICERDVVHRMNEKYGAWGALENAPNNGGLGTNEKCLCEGVIASTTLC